MDDRLAYKIDITFVIDATGGMTPYMSKVRENILYFGDNIVNMLASRDIYVKQLRFRTIDFADFSTEGENAIHSTEFFTLPDEKDKFREAVNGIDSKNRSVRLFGNGLEALFVAMNSDWTSFDVGKGHHVIVVISNTLPFKLQEEAGCAGYQPDLYPRDIEEMEQIWNEDVAQNAVTKLNPRRKMLFLCVPDGTIAGRTWDRLFGWENTYTYPVSEFSQIGEWIAIMIARYPDVAR